MDQNNNKVNINNVEYDVRDLSVAAQELLTLVSIADNNIRKAQADLILLQKGREGIVADLITEVEKPKEEPGEAHE